MVNIQRPFGHSASLCLTEFAHYHADTVEEQKAWMTKAVVLCEERAGFIARASSEKTFTLLEEDVSLSE
jgi:hypothetical protein